MLLYVVLLLGGGVGIFAIVYAVKKTTELRKEGKDEEVYRQRRRGFFIGVTIIPIALIICMIVILT